MGCDDEDNETQGTFGDTTAVGIMELGFELSDDIIAAVIAASQATTAGQMLVQLLLGPIKGELLIDKTLSAELDARLLIDSSLDDDFKSLSRSSSLLKQKKVKLSNFLKINCSCGDRCTHFILSMIYLSGMRPSLPATAPRHQSLLTCVYNVKVSPFLKLSSLSDRALKSN